MRSRVRLVLSLVMLSLFTTPVFSSCAAAPPKSSEAKDAWALRDAAYVSFLHHDYHRAQEQYQQAVAILRQSTTDQIPLARTLSELGRSYEKTSDYATAISFYQQSLAIYQKYATQHPAESTKVASFICETEDLLAKAYCSSGDNARSLTTYKQALSACREQSLSEWPRILKVEASHVRDASKGSHSSTLPLQEIFDAKELQYINTLRQAKRDRGAGKLDNANDLLAQAANAIPANADDADQLRRATYLGQQARNDMARGRFKEAQKSYEDAFAIRSKLLWDTHPDVHYTRQSLADIYILRCKQFIAAGDAKQAEEYLRKGRTIAPWIGGGNEH